MIKMLVSEELKTKRFKTYDGFISALENRVIERLYVKSAPLNILYDHNRDIFIAEFEVADVINGSVNVREFKVLPYAMSHLFSYLGLPDLTEYIRLCTKLDIMNTYPRINDHNKAFSKIEKWLKNNDRFTINLDRTKDTLNDAWFHIREKGSRTGDILLHNVKDIVGENVRAFTSDRYVFIPDRNIFAFTDDQFKKKTDWEFKKGVITPVQSKAHYFGEKEELVMGDKHVVGAVVSHSENKYSGYNISRGVWRQICTNGVWGTRWNRFTASHSNLWSKTPEEQFDIFSKEVAIIVSKTITGMDLYFKKYKELEEYKDNLIESWSSLLRYMDEIGFRKFDHPIKMRSIKKTKELITLAQKKGYEPNLYGTVQAMSFWGSNLSEDEDEIDTINNKTNKIILDANKISLWEPQKVEKEDSSQLSVEDDWYEHLE